MSGEERVVLNLMDSYWFEYGVLTAKTSHLKISPVVDHQMQETVEDEDKRRSKLNRTATLMRKSYSDQFMSSESDSSPSSSSSSDSSNSPSPAASVLAAGPQLQTILSGKQVDSFSGIHAGDTYNSCIYLLHTQEFGRAEGNRNREVRRINRSRRKSDGSSRSLSELELEELKGFMDLGFVFTTADDQTINMDSRLVSIIPGLQRLGKNNVDKSSSSVSRPYLSEAWGYSTNPSMDWRIPSFSNEMELKNHLRFWAHNVAAEKLKLSAPQNQHLSL